MTIVNYSKSRTLLGAVILLILIVLVVFPNESSEGEFTVIVVLASLSKLLISYKGDPTSNVD